MSEWQRIAKVTKPNSFSCSASSLGIPQMALELETSYEHWQVWRGC